MTPAIVYAAIAASLATLVVLLASLRMRFGISSRAAPLRMWLKTTPAQALVVMVPLLGLSALCAVSVDASLRSDNASETPLDVSLVEFSSDAATGTSADAKSRALSNLRAYASKIQDKKQSIDGLDANANMPNERSLPDVDTMIGRLAKRLESEAGDKQGWTMLAWSYAHTRRYREAVDAYKAALKLDPDNADLKSGLSFAQNQIDIGSTDGAGENQEQRATSDLPQNGNSISADQGVMVRGMVEQLAARLSSSPNDPDGWIRLIRSWTVLGETELAHDALRRADAAFAADAGVRGRIAEAAKTIGIDVK